MTQKQEREQYRQKVAKEYAAQLRELREENRKYKGLYLDLKEENRRLSEELSEKEEWIGRLLGYMDLSEEDFEKLKQSWNQQKQFQEHTGPIIGISGGESVVFQAMKQFLAAVNEASR